MKITQVTGLLLLVLALWPVAGMTAQPTSRIEELSKLDLAFMDRQRALLGELAEVELGRRFRGDLEGDLALLQTLLDRRLVRPDQTRELQAMGIVLGDLLSTQYDLHWIVYEDDVGRSRALRLRDTDVVVFPVTMISRRRAVGDNTPVVDIYAQAADIIQSSAPALPFQ